MKCRLSDKMLPYIFKKVAPIIFLFGTTSLYAQQSKIEDLKHLINSTQTDTAKIELYEKLGNTYRNEKKMDSSILSFQHALEINRKNNYSLQHQCWNVADLDYILYEMGNYTESLKYASQHLSLSKQLNDAAQIGAAYLAFGHNYRELGNYRLSLDNYFKAYHFWEIYHKGKNEPPDNTYTILCISETYLKMNNLDSAFIYAQQGYKLATTVSYGGLILLAERILGDIYFAKGDDKTALYYYRQYVPDYTKYKERNRDLGFVLNNISKIFQKRNEKDSAVFYAKKALSNAGKYQDQQNIYDAANTLYNLNDTIHNEFEAFKYYKIAQAAKDSMASIEKIRQIQALTFNEQTREKEQAAAEAKEAARNKLIIIIAAILISIISFLIWHRIRQLRLKHKIILEQKEVDKLNAKHEKELLELEAKALRAQMNPHFIFNCMNSIKSLIQQKDEDKAVTYLTTFSKLLRTVLQNSDKRKITLFDEIETCRLYTQLESMRFDNKFNYRFSIDENIDLKSLLVPALVIQPFIENAIWHGIMPKKEGGYVNVFVKNEKENISCTIDDNGIGREMSKQNKFKSGTSMHQSKGVHLAQSRLDLDNLLNQGRASIETIDKKDKEGTATGTTVIVNFKEY